MNYRLYTTWGFKIFINADESSMMKDRTTQSYEVCKFQWLINNLNPEDVFVDVGANKGDFTLLAASRCKHVYSIEPHPDNLYWLRKSVSANEFTNISIIEGCACDFTGKVSLKIGEKSGYHSIVREFPSHIMVSSFQLDNILPQKVPIVMKIDVEGAESLVLKGCENTLKYIRSILIDVDGGDVQKIENQLSNYSVVHREGNERFFTQNIAVQCGCKHNPDSSHPMEKYA